MLRHAMPVRTPEGPARVDLYRTDPEGKGRIWVSLRLRVMGMSGAWVAPEDLTPMDPDEFWAEIEKAR